MVFKQFCDGDFVRASGYIDLSLNANDQPEKNTWEQHAVTEKIGKDLSLESRKVVLSLLVYIPHKKQSSGLAKIIGSA